MPERPAWRRTAAGVLLDIRVIPRSPHTRIGGTRDGRLVVRVTAPPVDRAANEAAIRAIAKAIGLPPSALRIAAGSTSRNKTVEIQGGDPSAIERLVTGD